MKNLKSLIVLIILLLACSEDQTNNLIDETKYNISGSINGAAIAIENVLISYSGQNTSTDTNGSYIITELLQGVYEIIPSKTGFYFTPESRQITIEDQDANNIDFQILSDDEIQYNGSTWKLFNSAVYSIRENSGSLLQVDLTQNALWFQNAQGGLIYKLITGDFTISGLISAKRKTDDTQEVACSICLGGFMARNSGNSAGENYVHLVTGNTPNGIGVEYKSTLNGVSDFDATNDGSAEFELQISRIGDDFNLYKRAPGAAEWEFIITHNRPDLPETLQVGVNIYTAASGEVADLSIIYQNVSIVQ